MMLLHSTLLMLLLLAHQSIQAQNLQAKSPSARIAALREWAKKDADMRGVASLMAMLNAPEPEVRQEALRTWVNVAEKYGWAIYQAHIAPNATTLEEQCRIPRDAQQNWQKTFLNAVISRTSDKDQNVRKEAVRTLARLSASFENIIPPYGLQCGTGIEDFLSYQVDDCLTRVAKKNPILWFTLLKDDDPQIVYAVTSALTAAKYEPVYPVVLEFLKSPKVKWRLIGCNWLSYQKLVDLEKLLLRSEVQDCLSQMVQNKSPEFRELSVYALYTLCSKQTPTWATQLMLKLLEDEDSSVRWAAIHNLRPPQTPELRQKMEDLLLKMSQNSGREIADAAREAKDNLYADKSDNPMP